MPCLPLHSREVKASGMSFDSFPVDSIVAVLSLLFTFGQLLIALSDKRHKKKAEQEKRNKEGGS